MKRCPSRHSSGKFLVALSVLTTSMAMSRTVAGQNLNCNLVMQFGTFAACGVASTATLSPGGVLTTSGCVSPIGGSIPGYCILNNVAGTTLITVVGPGNLTSGVNNMVVDNFRLQISGSPAAATLSFTSPPVPIVEFSVGATIHIGATQTGGLYSGSYTITTNYP